MDELLMVLIWSKADLTLYILLTIWVMSESDYIDPVYLCIDLFVH
jgi:hypothetical protein